MIRPPSDLSSMLISSRIAIIKDCGHVQNILSDVPSYCDVKFSDFVRVPSCGYPCTRFMYRRDIKNLVSTLFLALLPRGIDKEYEGLTFEILTWFPRVHHK